MGSNNIDRSPVSVSIWLSLSLLPLLSAVSWGSPQLGRATDLYLTAYKLPLPWTWLGGRKRERGRDGKREKERERDADTVWFLFLFPILFPALSLLCQLSEMLCLTGSLSQISYHLKPLGRERWRPRKGSKWVYQCFFTPRELLDTKGKGIKDLKRAQKRESSL